jgi:hypothetical protein
MNSGRSPAGKLLMGRPGPRTAQPPPRGLGLLRVESVRLIESNDERAADRTAGRLEPLSIFEARPSGSGATRPTVAASAEGDGREVSGPAGPGPLVAVLSAPFRLAATGTG